MQLGRLKNIKSSVLLFSIFEFIYWSGNGMFYSFYVPFMTQKGLSNSLIGLILSVNALLLLITLPLWGILADKIKSTKIVIAVMFIFSSMIMMFIPHLDKLQYIAIGICTMAIFESGIASMFDSYIIQAIGQVPGSSYGSVRIWGSVGIISSLTLSARIVSPFGASFVFYYYGACLVILLPLLMYMPSISHNKTQKKKLNLMELLHNSRYIAFIIFVTFLFVPYRFSVSFLIQTILHTNGNTSNLSISLIFSYASEIVFYFFSIYIFKRYKLTKVILISGIIFVVRQLAFSLVKLPFQVALVQLTQGPSYTIMTASALLYIHKLAPQHLKSTAQALGNAILFGVSGVISNVLGGYLIDSIGIVKAFYAGTAISMFAVLSYSVFIYSTRIRNQSA